MLFTGNRTQEDSEGESVSTCPISSLPVHVNFQIFTFLSYLPYWKTQKETRVQFVSQNVPQIERTRLGGSAQNDAGFETGR